MSSHEVVWGLCQAVCTCVSMCVHRFAATLGELTGGRVGLVSGSVGVAKLAITIAVRYCSQRQQFGPPDAPEIAVLDYQVRVCVYVCVYVCVCDYQVCLTACRCILLVRGNVFELNAAPRTRHSLSWLYDASSHSTPCAAVIHLSRPGA